MNRILIVDDEHHIVNWLSWILENVPDLELEINRAYTGEEALALLERHRMDILLLDIQMPGISGLQVAEEANRSWPSSYIIFLTGYDYFSYIYQASRLEHVSYLIKTEPDERIIQEVRNCLSKIEADKKQLQLNRQASSHDLVVKHLLQADFLEGLLHGKKNFEIRHIVKKYHIGLTIDLDRPLFAGLLFLSAGRGQSDALDNYVLIRQELPCLFDCVLRPEDHFALLPSGTNHFLCLIQPDSISESSFVSAEDYLKNIFEEFLPLCENSLSCFCIIVLCTDMLEWDSVYDTLLSLQEYCLQVLPAVIEGSFCKPVCRSRLVPFRDSPSAFPAVSVRQLHADLQLHLSRQEQSKFFQSLDEICSLLCRTKSMHNLEAIELYMKTSSVLIECINQFQLQEKISLQIDLYSLYYTVNFTSWKEASAYLRRLSEILFRELSVLETDRSLELVSLIKHYIREHLSENLSLSVIAEQFSYNSSYLSHLFKQTTGIGLSEYVTGIRMAKASELLSQTSESISLIAEKTGFDTTQYFSYVFKKRIGSTPSEYRLSHRIGDKV